MILLMGLCCVNAAYGQMDRASENEILNSHKADFFGASLLQIQVIEELPGYLTSRANPSIWIKENPEPNASGRWIALSDMMQHTSTIAVFGLNALGIHGKHNFKDRVVILGTSGMIMIPLVYGLKVATQVERPDGSGNDGFPSGHASFAFLGAEFMRMEFEHLSPLPGVFAYSLAALTGFIRLYEKKHRPVDVFAGAFAGMASIRLAYLLYPVVNELFPFQLDGNIDMYLSPWSGANGAGFALTISL